MLTSPCLGPGCQPSPTSSPQDVGQGVVITHPVPGFTDFLPSLTTQECGLVLDLHAKKPVEPDRSSWPHHLLQGPHVAGRMSKLRLACALAAPPLGVRLWVGSWVKPFPASYGQCSTSLGLLPGPEILRSTYFSSKPACSGDIL